MTRAVSHVLFLSFLAVLSACDDETSAIADLRTHSDPLLIASWGDSLTAGGWQTRLQELLSPSNPGIQVKGFGLTGQMAGGIAVRQGGVTLKLSVQGNVIPVGAGPSNPVPVVSITPSNLGVALNLTAHGTLGGVPGLLDMTLFDLSLGDLTSVFFVPDAVQVTDMPILPSTTFVADGSPGWGGNNGASVADQGRGSYKAINIFWIGRNDVAWAWPYGTEAPANALRSMVAVLTPDDAYFLVLAVPNGETEPSGSQGHQLVTLINQGLQAAFPDKFVDLRRYLIDKGLQDAGIAPTAQDLQNITDDVVPVSLRLDSLHLNQAGNELVARLIAAELTRRGWERATK